MQWQPAVTVAIVLAIAGVSLFQACAHLRITHEGRWTGAGQHGASPAEQAESFLDDASDVVVVARGKNRPESVSAIETIARELGSFPQYFTSVVHRVDAEKLRSKGLYQLPISDLKLLADKVQSLRAVGQSFDQGPRLVEMLVASRGILEAVQAGASSMTTARPLILQTAATLESLAGFLEPQRIYRSPWADVTSESVTRRIRGIPEHFFTHEGDSALLRVTLAANDRSLLPGQEPIRVLREIVARTGPLFPGVEMTVIGNAVVEHDQLASARRGVISALVVSVIGLIVVFFIGARRPRHSVFVAVTLMAGFFCVLGTLASTLGYLPIAALGALVALLGIGIGEAVAWVTGFEVRHTFGRGARTTNIATARSLGGILLIASLAVSIPLFSLMAMGQDRWFEIGRIAGSAALVAALVTFTLLPALMTWSASDGVQRDRDHSPTLRSVGRWPKSSLVILSLLTLVAVLGLGRLRFEEDLSGTGAPASSNHAVDPLGTHAISIANSAEEARRLAAQFTELPAVGRVIEIASLIPADQPSKYPIVARIHEMLAPLPERGNWAAPATTLAELEPLIEDLAESRKFTAPTDDIIAQRLTRAAQETIELLGPLPPAEKTRRIEKFQELWSEDLLLQARKLQAISQPEPVTVHDLPTPLVSRFYRPSGHWAIQIFAKDPIRNASSLREFREQLATVDSTITGRSTAGETGLGQLIWRVPLVSAFGLAGAGWLFGIRLGRGIKIAIALLPAAIGVLTTLGIHGWLLLPVTLSTGVALALVAAVGLRTGGMLVHDLETTDGPYVLLWKSGRSVAMGLSASAVSAVALMVAMDPAMMSLGRSLFIGTVTIGLTSLATMPALLRLLTRQRAGGDTDESADNLPSTVFWKQAA